MKAVYYVRQGAASDVLEYGELLQPVPGAGEVRVRVHVSGVNPTDLKARSGSGAPMAFPRVVPHQDGSGIIDAVGEGVDPARIGERVWIYEAQSGRSGGTAAEFVTVPVENDVRLPDDVSFAVGASLGIPALTAHRCLFADGDIKARKVLVHGGAGVVGTAAILLAKWAGAWVATTVSNDEQAAIAHENGADLVLNRHKDDVALAIMGATKDAGVDRIVEVDLKANAAVDLMCLARGGVVSTYATRHPDDDLTIPLLKCMLRGYLIRFVFVYSVPKDAKLAGVEAVSACVSAGAYNPRIGLTVGLKDVVKAHQALEQGKVTGKVLVTVAE